MAGLPLVYLNTVHPATGIRPNLSDYILLGCSNAKNQRDNYLGMDSTIMTIKKRSMKRYVYLGPKTLKQNDYCLPKERITYMV